MDISMLTIIQWSILGLGVGLVITALALYIRRTANWHAFWQVWVGRLKDFNMGEFKLYRGGILLLFVGILLRIVNLTLYG